MINQPSKSIKSKLNFDNLELLQTELKNYKNDLRELKKSTAQTEKQIEATKKIIKDLKNNIKARRTCFYCGRKRFISYMLVGYCGLWQCADVYCEKSKPH